MAMSGSMKVENRLGSEKYFAQASETLRVVDDNRNDLGLTADERRSVQKRIALAEGKHSANGQTADPSTATTQSPFEIDMQRYGAAGALEMLIGFALGNEKGKAVADGKCAEFDPWSGKASVVWSLDELKKLYPDLTPEEQQNAIKERLVQSYAAFGYSPDSIQVSIDERTGEVIVSIQVTEPNPDNLEGEFVRVVDNDGILQTEKLTFEDIVWTAAKTGRDPRYHRVSEPNPEKTQ